MEALTLVNWAFDLLLALLLLWVAWLALSSADLFRVIVLFISFGLLMTLAWARLDAPDVALVEIVIGAGLTGALLLSAWARLTQKLQIPAQDSSEPPLHQKEDAIDNDYHP